jgi:renalase
MTRVAIIGAGIAGLTIAKRLSKRCEISVFEKARGVGGRMSTRYAPPFYFDHGAQFFTAKTSQFQEFLKPYIETGAVAEWQGKIVNLEVGQQETEFSWPEPHWVANPNMNSLCKDLSRGLDVHLSSEVAPLAEKNENGWTLNNKDLENLGHFDWVISTAPAMQTLRLFGQHVPAESSLHAAKMLGCYTLMIGFKRPWDRSWIAAKPHDNTIQWISVNSSKPFRDQNMTSLVVHSKNDWAEEHIDDEVNDVEKFLLEQFFLLTGIDPRDADFVTVHRWRYAKARETQKSGGYIDSGLGIAASGDWCETSRIEDVWLQANNLATRMEQIFS